MDSYPQPRNGHILVELVASTGDSLIVLPEKSHDTRASSVVRAVAPGVTCCKLGDTLCVAPNLNGIGYDKKRQLMFIHESAVIAVEPEIIAE